MTTSRQFLLALFPEWPPNCFAELRAIENGAVKQSWHRSVTDLLAEAVRLKDGHDVYFGVSARRGKNGRKSGVAYVSALWCDLDDAENGTRLLASFEFPPSAIVESGHGLHPYWFLKEPYIIEDESDVRRVEAANRGLAKALGGDSCWDISRVLRVPDTVNHKNGASVDVRLAKLDTQRRYNLSDFEHYAVEADDVVPATADFGEAPDAAAVLEKCIGAGISDETVGMIAEGAVPERFKSRSERDASVVSRLILDVELSDSEIRSLFLSYPLGGKYREQKDGDRYLGHTIGKARARLSETPDPVTGARSWEAVIEFRTPVVLTAPSLPESAWRGLFADYRDAVGQSTEAADEHHFAAFDAVVGAYFGRRVSCHYGRLQYLPGYVALIGPTHDKKTTAQRRAVNDLLPLLQPAVGTIAALASAEGLVEWLAKQDMSPLELATFIKWMANSAGEEWERLYPEHRRGLASIEELAALLQKAKAEGSSQIISALTQLYDQPLELEPPLRSRRIVAEAPTLGVIASSTPDWFVKNLRDIDIMGGFANRWTYWTGNPKPPMPWPDKPKQKALRAIAESVTRAYERWEPGTEFGLAAEAKAAWESFYESWTNQARKDGDLPTSKMESRIPEHTVKLALCYAALENTEATISGDQMAAAIEVAGYLRESVRYAFSDRLTASEHPLVKLESRILSLLAERGPMKKRDLSRFAKQRNTTASDFNRVLEGLIKAGAVTFDTETRLVGLADD